MNDENADASTDQNQNLIRSLRKRHIAAVESEETEIKRKRQRSMGKSIPTIPTLDHLPPEMLEAVLRNLPTSDLLKCPQFNRKFNEIASRIMRKRADIQLHFSAVTKDGHVQFMRTIQHRHCQEMLVNICVPYGKASCESLNALVAILKVAKHFPITSFRFDDLNQFGNEDMESFLSIWGTKIVALDVSLKNVGYDFGILRNLLVKTIPNLKELQINFSWERNPASVELVADSNDFQLPNLQVLRTNTYYSAYRPMIATIANAAQNLKTVYIFYSERFRLWSECVEGENTTDDLAMIQTLNKFHCLKDLRIELSEDLIRFLALKRIDFKLESFAVSVKPSVCEDKQLKSSATAILNQIFQSSKDVIQTLRIEPLGSLGPDLHIPKMKNLRKLGLFGKSFQHWFLFEADDDVAIFSPPFQMADNFPNLKELVLNDIDGDDSMFRTRQHLKPMPSIEILRIFGKLRSKCRENLLKATPNVTTLVIGEDDEVWENKNRFYVNFRMIARFLPKLQSLGWLIQRLTHHDLLHSLDAAITGLPVKFCEKISKKFRNKNTLSAEDLASYQLEQRNSSILDLKELKQFDVNFLLNCDAYADMAAMEWVECNCEDLDCDSKRFMERDDEAGFSPGDFLYKTGFSKNTIAKNDKSDANMNDENADASTDQNQNLIRSLRKRHIAAVESEETEIKRKRQRSMGKSIPTIPTLDHLPPEMLEAVLRNLPTSDLLKCPQFNRKFNEIASRIMRKRADIQLHFSAVTKDGHVQFMRTIQHRHCQEMLVNICVPYGKASCESLNALVAILKVAKHFPITSFRFDDLNQFGNEDMESFLSIWGTKIVALDVSLKNVGYDFGILRNLLVKTIPNLKELQINFSWERNPASVELVADSNDFQLPNLQVLRTNTYYSAYRPMIATIANAAQNLKTVYIFYSERFRLWSECVEGENTTDDLAMIQTLNKFHCLKDLRIELSEDLIRFLALKRIDFKLESFAVSVKPSVCEDKQLKSSATAILNQIFQSSKDVIQTLRIEPLGSLGPDLHIPKMKNLRKLGLFGKSFQHWFLFEADDDVAIFSPPFQMADNFPNLKELVLNDIDGDDSMFRTRQHLKPMPSIEILRIFGKLRSKCRENLLKATPNVTTLVIGEDDEVWENKNRFYVNFRMIARFLPKLQSLGWLIQRLTHHDLLHSLDAAITGLPVKFCEKISKKFRNKNTLSAEDLASYQLEQRNSSILDLKELKQFDVNFLLNCDAYADMAAMEWVECNCEDLDCDSKRFMERDDEAGFSPGDFLYKTGFSKVSKFLAFDLMPNLTVRTHRYTD